MPTLSTRLLIVQLLVALAAATITQGHTVPKISIHDLQGSNIGLHQILHESGGILRISVNEPQFSDSNPPKDNLMYNIAMYREEALTSLCTCSALDKTISSSHLEGNDVFRDLLEAHPKDVQQINLPDGSTRRTLATATIGFDGNNADGRSSHPLQLPLWFQEQCGHDAYNAMENLRDAVSKVVTLFVDKLDSEKWTDHKYNQVLQSANHLEHFHVYFKDGITSEKENYLQHSDVKIGNADSPSQLTSIADVKQSPTLNYHIDAGFFLSFVPAMNCHTYSVDDSSFYIKSQEQAIKFEEDEVVILMGAGAQYWMNSNPKSDVEDDSSFVATLHALQLSPDAHRSWYGKMHLLPSSLKSDALYAGSFPGNAEESAMTYGEVLPTFKLEDYEAHVPSTPVDGCGTILPESQGILTSVSPPQAKHRHSRRRLQHVGSPANCNNDTNFFCWYQCVSIPDANHTLEYLKNGYSLYCLDPSMLSDNDVADAAAPCKNGYTHNADCSGSWQLTDDNLPGYVFPNYAATLEDEKATTHLAPDTGDEYCYGATSMYMDGFNWIGSTCVVYLFPQLILSTSEKFALACIGSILFGIILEYILWKRRAVYTMKPGRHRLVLSVMAYGLQLTMGYFVMLIIMTYSGPLFISTVVGMMGGHALFNAQDSFVKWKDKTAKDSQDVANGTSGHGETERALTELANSYQNVKSSSRNSSDIDEESEEAIGVRRGVGAISSNEKPFGVTEKTKLKENIPEGVTPCCQYVL